MFLTWSSLLIAVIAFVTVLDGGVSSPLAVLFLLPPIFAALSYPLASMVAVAVVANATYVGTAVAVGGVSANEAGVVALTLSAAGWMCAWQAREHDRRRADLARVSRADPLTGALNRRGFDERLVGELARAERADAALGLILIDLDDFKGTNDRLGHAAGDDQLRRAV